MSSARHLQTDGASDVINRVVKDCIRFYHIHRPTDSDILLPAAAFAQNSAVENDPEVSSFKS